MQRWINTLKDQLIQAWYKGHVVFYLLWPLSLVFSIIIKWRKVRLQKNAAFLDLPVIVVGNISVGGAGKTPVVIALVEALKQAGLRPGVILRGYGGKAPHYPYEVALDSPLEAVWDEALMIKQKTAAMVVVGPDRLASARYIERQGGCDVIISDDGLQHYALARDMEVIVIDAKRGLGSGLLLPAGPLREGKERLKETPWVLSQNQALAPYSYEIRIKGCRHLTSGAEKSMASFVGQKVHAFAGIGNPDGFFKQLKDLGIECIAHPMSDHSRYGQADFAGLENAVIMLTDKDAVKVKDVAPQDTWVVEIEALLPEPLVDACIETIKKKG